MTAKHPYLEWLAPRLEALRVQILRFETAGSHGKLYLSHNGRERFVTIPLTPSDPKGVRNCLQNIRKEFGLQTVTAGAQPPRPRKARAPRPVPPPLPVTEGADPWAALRPLAQAIDPARDPVPEWLRRSIKHGT